MMAVFDNSGKSRISDIMAFAELHKEPFIIPMLEAIIGFAADKKSQVV